MLRILSCPQPCPHPHLLFAHPPLNAPARPPSLPGQVRVYTKPRGQIADFSSPVICGQDSRSMEDFCNRIHKGILREFKYA